MSFNTFGKIFRFTTWGESHGVAIGCVVDGCPPNIALSEKNIQIDMDRRRPWKSKFTSQRKEYDKVKILSDWSWVNPTYSFKVDTNKKEIYSVEIDPSMKMADVDRSNNYLLIEK